MKKYLLIFLLLICRPAFAVNFIDLALLAQYWLFDAYEGDADIYDYDFDGQIAFGDAGVMFIAWTKPSPACAKAPCSDCSCRESVGPWKVARDCELREDVGYCFCGGSQLWAQTRKLIGKCCPHYNCCPKEMREILAFKVYVCGGAIEMPCSPSDCSTVGDIKYYTAVLPVGAVCK